MTEDEGFKETTVGTIPSDWEVATVVDIAHVTTGSRNTQDKVEDGQFPFFVRSQTVERIDSFSFDGEAVLTAGDGVGTGKIFHYINGPFDCHQRVYRISDFTERMNGFFFYKYFSTSFFDRIMSMTAKSSVDSVRREMIADMAVPVPPIKEQEAISFALKDIDDLIASLDALIAKKRDIKQAAMQQLLTGKTRLPGFDEGWKLQSFANIFTFLKSGINSRSDLSTDGEVSYVHYGDIHACASPRMSALNLPKIAASKVGGLPRVKTGDLIFADASEDYAGVGKSVEMVECEGRDVVSGLHTILARGNPELLADGFKGYIQMLPDVKAALIRIANGISVYGISKTGMRPIEAYLPGKDEQSAIARVLQDMDAELESLAEKRGKAVGLKDGMMQQLLTGRIRLV